MRTIFFRMLLVKYLYLGVAVLFLSGYNLAPGSDSFASTQKNTVMSAINIGSNNGNSNSSNNDEFKLINTVPLKANFITTDFLKNAYFITSKNQVMRYDSTGNVTGVYSETQYGPAAFVDAKTPFNILVFYKEFATVVMLDMRMNNKRIFKLPNIGISSVSAACLSDDNYFWVFDQNEQRLKKINNNYEVIHKSMDLRQLLGVTLNPNFLTESNGLIYLNVPELGILMFDIFGTFYSSISNTDIDVYDLKGFQVINDKLVFYNNGELTIISPASLQKEIVPIPRSNNVIDVRLEAGNLYQLENNEAKFYMISK